MSPAGERNFAEGFESLVCRNQRQYGENPRNIQNNTEFIRIMENL